MQCDSWLPSNHDTVSGFIHILDSNMSLGSWCSETNSREFLRENPVPNAQVSSIIE